MSRARQGKVARLPAAIRETVNKQLYDGLSGPAIIGQLNMAGYSNITEQNLSEWRKGCLLYTSDAADE